MLKAVCIKSIYKYGILLVVKEGKICEYRKNRYEYGKYDVFYTESVGCIVLYEFQFKEHCIILSEFRNNKINDILMCTSHVIEFIHKYTQN